MDEPIKYGLVVAKHTLNLGDVIQSIAAKRFLPRVDVVIDRDLPADSIAAGENRIVAIFNGWFSHRPEGWPPPASVAPLLISMHISPIVYDGWTRLQFLHSERSFADSAAEYMKRWGPVGARDLYTLKLLESAGIPAYLSGCLTLTLDRDKNAIRDDYIACVDLPDDVVAELKNRTHRPIVAVTHQLHGASLDERFKRAEEHLSLYQRAHCVITTRLHGALPCLAFETPVLVLDTAEDQTRFSGLQMLFRHCDVNRFLSRQFHFDVENPEANDLDYLKFRNLLIDRARRHVEGAGQTGQDFSEAALLQMRYNTLWTHCAELTAEIAQLGNRASEAERERDNLSAKLASLAAEHQQLVRDSALISAMLERRRRRKARVVSIIPRFLRAPLRPIYRFFVERFGRA